MEEFFTNLINSIPPDYYGLFVMFSAILENVFPPWPGDTTIVIGGSLAGAGKMSLWSLCIYVYIGSILGGVFMYYMGSRVLALFRDNIKWKSVQELTDPAGVAKTYEWFERNGVFTVVFSRFMTGIRFFVAIIAGMAKMPPVVFIIALSIGAALWNGLLITGGYLVGDNIWLIKNYLKLYGRIILFVGLVLIFTYIMYSIVKRELENRQKN